MSRRINVNDADGSETLFDKLREKILTMIPADQDVGLYWFDSAGFRILCETDEELRIALEECPSAANGIVELSAVLREPKPRPQSLVTLDNTRVEPGAPEAATGKVRKRKYTPYASLPKTSVCEICGFAFTCKAHLVAHMRTHTGEKPFACDLCDMTFREKRALTNHVKGHNGLLPPRDFKPFKCPFPNCKYEARVKSYMSEHILQMHGPRTAESEDRELLRKRRALVPRRPRKGKKKRDVDDEDESASGHREPSVKKEEPVVKEEEEKEPLPSRVLRSSKMKDSSAKVVPPRVTNPSAQKPKNTLLHRPEASRDGNNTGPAEVVIFVQADKIKEEFPPMMVTGGNRFIAGFLPSSE